MHDFNARTNRSFRAPHAAPTAPHALVPSQVPGPAREARPPHTHMNHERCRLSLIKGDHRWRFRWEPGSEAAMISVVADLARNPRMNFDWFDAAVVCRHIAQGLPEPSSDPAGSPPSSSTPGNK